MTVEVENHRDPLRAGERTVTVVGGTDTDEKGRLVREVVSIHPWHRRDDRSVYVSVGLQVLDDTGWRYEEDEEGSPLYWWNTIANRDDFLDALLLAFPDELIDAR